MEENKEKLQEIVEQPAAEAKPKKKKKKGKIPKALYNIILILLIAIFAISAYNVIKIGLKYFNNQKTYKEVQKAASPKGFDGNIDFAALSQINPDIKAWIYLKDTKIDYPIVQGADNDIYLHTKFNGEWGSCGTLFADCATNNAFEQFVTIVYGHHMKDGSMFATLKKYNDKDFFDSHQRLELITPSTKYHMDVISFAYVQSDGPFYQPNVDTEDAKLNYINLIESSYTYRSNLQVSTSDKIVVLSTCVAAEGPDRYLLIGKLTPWKKQN